MSAFVITLIVSVILTALTLIFCFIFYPFGLALIPSVVGGVGTLGILTTAILLSKKAKAKAEAFSRYNCVHNHYKDNLDSMHTSLQVEFTLDLISHR